MLVKYVLVGVVLIVSEAAIALALTCLDDNGKPVDYLVIYKLPRLEHAQHKLIRSGVAYVYLDANNPEQWILSDKSIEDKHSALGASVTPLFDANNKLEHVVYNDQPPFSNDNSAKFAHAKGIVALDATSGFWIRHSVPKLIDLSARSYDYPNNGWVNGQLMVCVTLDRKDKTTIDNIGKHLFQMRPFLFTSTLSKDFVQDFPIFNDLIQHRYNKKDKTFVGPITSAKGTKFVSFSKSAKFNDDLYSALIAPYFKEALMAQTWRNGPGGKLNSDCDDTYHVMNIKQISLKKISYPAEWSVKEDHSKWAVSNTSTPALFCASDINRMKSQFRRGGGSLCILSKSLWKAFDSVVEDLETCPRKSRIIADTVDDDQIELEARTLLPSLLTY